MDCETPKQAYDRGASLRYLKRHFHMSNSEISDLIPDEDKEIKHEPEGAVGGY